MPQPIRHQSLWDAGAATDGQTETIAGRACRFPVGMTAS
jgi:hypothetical protein